MLGLFKKRVDQTCLIAVVKLCVAEILHFGSFNDLLLRSTHFEVAGHPNLTQTADPFLRSFAKKLEKCLSKGWCRLQDSNL